VKTRFYKLAVIILILILAVGSCRKAGTWLVKTDIPEHADAMLMLMGIQSERVLQIDDLYQEKKAGEVWIVKEGMGAMAILEERGAQIISTTQEVQGYFISLGIPADSIVILPGGAISTQMEATLLRDYLASLAASDQAGIDTFQAGIDTLLLVSSASHMRRASMIFSAAVRPLDNPPVICTCPSSYSNFNAEKWWRSREDIQDVFFEYLKIANFVLFEKRDLK
jgi:uncharacterized SAM-binding protein YcdF (DUF218 family)